MENNKSKSEAIITGKSRIRGSGSTYVNFGSSGSPWSIKMDGKIQTH